MEISDLFNWGTNIIILGIVPLLVSMFAAISRNGRETAELRGRIDTIERMHGHLSEELRNVHQRVGGVAKTTNQISGQMLQMGTTLTLMHEHLLQRDRSSS